jgi:hypothetical protein
LWQKFFSPFLAFFTVNEKKLKNRSFFIWNWKKSRKFVTLLEDICGRFTVSDK